MTYRKITDINELPTLHRLHELDLSGLDLRGHGAMFTGPFGWAPAIYDKGVKGWTDSVIWPDAPKMPDGFDPRRILEESKAPLLGVAGLHARERTGRGVSIAIIDQRLYLNHPDYADRIRYYEVIGDNWGNDGRDGTDYHGSLVVGNAVGRTCGTAPGADIHYVAANNWIHDANGKITEARTSELHNLAIRKVIDTAANNPDYNIRFLSCSWGVCDSLFADEGLALLDEAERAGIMVLGADYKHTKRIGAFDARYAPRAGLDLSVPTDGKTTPYFRGGYCYERLGGFSSAVPYLAGVFAMALQGNQSFARQAGWQERMMRIARVTATATKSGAKIINPTAIVDEVARADRSTMFDKAEIPGKAPTPAPATDAEMSRS
ncbi:MAG: S8/S53 family peptidase [Rickettsiales bacterium]|jgi:hypothetical protein|nr:S8/S53 family peptidase [Rickettsiales bacterium]